jgi:hypothetical protein
MILLDVYNRIGTVEALFRAAEASASYFFSVCRANPTHIHGTGLRVRDIRDCANDLEDTYLVRAYAVFEITLRDYWENRIRNTHPKAEQLINGVAARCTTLSDELRDAHAVREYRNWLVHGGAMPAKVTMAQAKSYMNKFLRHLPSSW